MFAELSKVCSCSAEADARSELKDILENERDLTSVPPDTESALPQSTTANTVLTAGESRVLFDRACGSTGYRSTRSHFCVANVAEEMAREEMGASKKSDDHSNKHDQTTGPSGEYACRKLQGALTHFETEQSFATRNIFAQASKRHPRTSSNSPPQRGARCFSATSAARTSAAPGYSW